MRLINNGILKIGTCSANNPVMNSKKKSMSKVKDEFSKWEFEDEDPNDPENQDPAKGGDDPGDGDDPEKNSQVVTDDTEIEVEIDGKKEKLTLAEIKKGYMRQSDYTKKTQELSKGDEKKITDQAKKVVENPDEFPEADVKAAEYFLKIAKSKFGLITREEYEAEKNYEKAVSEFETTMKSSRGEINKMRKDVEGTTLPVWDDAYDEKVMEFMKENGVRNPKVAYLAMNDAAYRDHIIKQSKGSKGYKTETKGDKPEDKGGKKFNVHTEEGHRDFLQDQINKMKSN